MRFVLNSPAHEILCFNKFKEQYIGPWAQLLKPSFCPYRASLRDASGIFGSMFSFRFSVFSGGPYGIAIIEPG
jgi:hypothetical protein